MVPPHEPLFSNLFFLLVLLSDEGHFQLNTLLKKTQLKTYKDFFPLWFID